MDPYALVCAKKRLENRILHFGVDFISPNNINPAADKRRRATSVSSAPLLKNQTVPFTLNAHSHWSCILQHSDKAPKLWPCFFCFFFIFLLKRPWEIKGDILLDAAGGKMSAAPDLNMWLFYCWSIPFTAPTQTCSNALTSGRLKKVFFLERVGGEIKSNKIFRAEERAGVNK